MTSKPAGSCGIYAIRNRVNGSQYIGSSCCIERRWREHRRCLELNDHHSQRLQAAWNKYGKDNFEFIVLTRCSLTQLIELEQYMVDDLKPAYNMAQIVDKPGYGRIWTASERQKVSRQMRGVTKTAEHKLRISEALRGRKFSAEHREKMRAAGKRKIFTDKHRAALSAGHVGRVQKPHTDETRAKISAAKLGHKLGPFSDKHKAAISASRMRYCFYCVELNRWFESTKAVHRFVVEELNRTAKYYSVSTIMSGLFSDPPAQKTAYGFHWQRILKETA